MRPCLAWKRQEARLYSTSTCSSEFSTLLAELPPNVISTGRVNCTLIGRCGVSLSIRSIVRWLRFSVVVARQRRAACVLFN